MSQYLLIVATLREYDLITDEQQKAAIAEWQQMMDEINERQMKFRDEWIAAWKAQPRWRRFWGFRETEWLLDWYKQENGDPS